MCLTCATDFSPSLAWLLARTVSVGVAETGRGTVRLPLLVRQEERCAYGWIQ